MEHRTLETKQTELADVLITMSSVLEAQARFENTLYGYFIRKKVVFPIVEMYIFNTWEKYGVKRVMEDKNDFFFIQFTCATSLERVLEHGPWLICNAPFILRKWSQSYVLSKKELTFVLVWIKFHGGMDYVRALVDIRVDRALIETMVISIPNSIGNGVSMHTIKNLRKHGGTSNDGFQTGQRKCIYDPLVSKHRTKGNHSLPKQQDDNGKPMDDLFDDIKKKVGAPPKKTVFGQEDGKRILLNPWESDVYADVENGYDETSTSIASTSLVDLFWGFAGWDLVCIKNRVHVLTMEKGFLIPKRRLSSKGVKEKDCLAADDSNRTPIHASEADGFPSYVVPNEASSGPTEQVSGFSNDSSGNNVSHDTTLKVVVETVATMPTNEVPSLKSFAEKYGIVRVMMNAKGFFFFKFASIEGMNGVKIHEIQIVAFTADGLSLVDTKLGKPFFLDSYTSFMCLQSWGRMDYARAFIDIRANRELKEVMVIAIHNIEDDEDVLHSVRVEYEWKPSRCGTTDKGKGQTSRADDEGFIEVRKNKSGDNNYGTKNFTVSMKPKTQYRLKAKQLFEGMSNSLKMTPFVSTNKASTSCYNKESRSNKGNTFSLSNSYEALNDENLIIKEVA
nr:hypothetical protein [Tanacetum cinerariifolium]